MVNNPSAAPIYDLLAIQLLVAERKFQLVNERATTKVQELGWDIQMIQSFLRSLKPPHFHKSYPKQQAYGGRKIIDVDAYKMHFDEDNRCEGNRAHCCFWTKVAIETLSKGDHVAIVSLHLDGSP